MNEQNKIRALCDDIAAADADIAAGRVSTFDADKIIKKGQEKSKRHRPSKNPKS